MCAVFVISTFLKHKQPVVTEPIIVCIGQVVAVSAPLSYSKPLRCRTVTLRLRCRHSVLDNGEDIEMPRPRLSNERFGNTL